MKRFEVGARVVEPTYGLGSVIAVEDAYTRVQFDEHGVKKFLTSMSQLEPSDEPVPAGLRERQAAQEARARRRPPPQPPPPKTSRADDRSAPLIVLYDTDIPSPDGDTIVVQSDGLRLDRVQEVSHLAALVHDVVREEQAALVEPRIDQVEESLVVLLPRVEEDEVERALELRDLLERVAGDDLDDVGEPGALDVVGQLLARGPGRTRS